MKANSTRFTLMTVAVLIALFSCGKSSSSSSSGSSSSSYNHENPNHPLNDNFTQSDKEVSTTRLVTYDWPSLLERKTQDVDIEVSGEKVFAYKTRVNLMRSFTYTYPDSYAYVGIFDFEGQVDVRLTLNEELFGHLESARITPSIYGIGNEIIGNTVNFRLDYPADYTVEINNDFSKVVHLFANPTEENPVDPDNVPEGTLYIGPGIYEAGAIPLNNNETVYLAGGAYVYGQIRTENLENIQIRGRGIIAGELFERRSQNEFTIPLQIRFSDEVLVEGITFLDPAGWAVALYHSSNITFENVKIITSRANGDGISVQSCENVAVNGGFVRSWDDSLVVKNVDRGITSNIVFDGVTVWTDLAQSMEVGYETYGESMTDITFRNIIVLHNFHKATMSIHNADDAEISNVTFKNILIEDSQNLGDNQNDGLDDLFIDLRIAYSPEWTKSAGERGSVENVTFENIKVNNMAASVISRAQGESVGSAVRNITFKEIRFMDTDVVNMETLKLNVNQFVSDIHFASAVNPSVGAKISLPYAFDLIDRNVAKTVGAVISQDGLLVPEFARLKGGLAFAGVKASGSFAASATHGAGTTVQTPADDGSGPFETADHEAAKAIDNNLATTYESKAWMSQPNEFAALTFQFADNAENARLIGNIRVRGIEGNAYSYRYRIEVRAQTASGTAYVRKSAVTTYTLSPATGNAFEIKITPDRFKGVQLRIFKEEALNAPANISFAEVEFYAPSLSYNKPIVDSTAHADVYPADKLTDGVTGGTSYYESATLPAHIVVDLGTVYSISVIVLNLPPVLLWDARTQNIAISGSSSNAAYNQSTTAFTSIKEASDYLFDPTKGNLVTINLESPVSVRYLKFIINSNSASGGLYGGQLSEISVYGE